MLQRLSFPLDEEPLRGDGLWPRARKAAVLEGALESAWKSLCDRKGQMLASEVVAFVRARCPGVAVFRIRCGIEQRLRQRGALW